MISESAARFDTAVSLIMGFPYETVEDFLETIQMAVYATSKGTHPQVAILSPLPQAPLTASDHPIEFWPDMVSGMVFSEYTSRADEATRAGLSMEVCELIRSDPKTFSAFYHFKDGRIREKVELAKQYGVIRRPVSDGDKLLRGRQTCPSGT
jgi:hypothetical protein